MGRIRSLKPEFFSSPTMARCSIPARVTFQGLWSEADDHGRGIAESRIIKGAIWPLDDEITPEIVESHLVELADESDPAITFYESEGRRYYRILNWEKHQSAAFRRGEPRHPAPPRVRKARGRVQEATLDLQGGTDGVLEQGAGSREQGGEQGLAPVARDVVFETVAEVCGIDWSALTPSARGSLNKAVKEIKTTLGAVRPHPAADAWAAREIRRRGAEYRARYPDAALTPSALAKHWPSLNGDAATMTGGKGAILRAASKLLPGAS